MKRKLSLSLLALLCLFIFDSVKAQTYCNGYTTNTDWRNYAAPTNPPTTPLPPYQQINNFDWTTNFFTIYKDVNSVVTPDQIQSPFWENTNAIANEPNVDHFRNKFLNNGFYTNPTQAIASVDIWPEDGWELLYKDFGTTTTAYGDNPSFGLYNRYTGIMRIFYYVVELGNTASSTARISIRPKLGDRNNALLSFTETEIKALDAFERHFSSGLNYAQVLDNFWLFIEIPLAFDPCVCHYPAESNMDFKFEIVKNGVLVLEGNATGFSNPTIYNNGVYTPYKSHIISSHTNKNSSTNFLADANGYYKTLSNFKDNLNTLISNQSSSGTDKTKAATEVNTLFDSWVSIAKNIPKIGAAIGVIDFLVTGGKAKNTATKEPTPVGYETELNIKLTGNITEDQNLSNLSLRTPGANGVGGPNPIYNNPLGVFNLLESPPIEYVEYSSTAMSAVIQRDKSIPAYNVPISNNANDPFFSAFKIREYKLRPSSEYGRLINFIINPSSQLEAKQIKGALLFKFSDLPNFIDTSNYYKYIFGPVEFGILVDDRAGLGFVHRMRMCGYEIESWPEGTSKIKDITFRTNYTNIGCLEDEASFFSWDFIEETYDNPEVWVKLDIDLKRMDDYALANPTQTQDVLMILKYKANVTLNSTPNLTYTSTIITTNVSLPGYPVNNGVQYREGYEILPNGDYQPRSVTNSVIGTFFWNGSNGVVRQHNMSPSPWSNPINKRYGTLIVDNSNVHLFVPPPAHSAGTTVNAYNLYLHPSLPSFNTDLAINVGNHVYSSNNWSRVNTNIDWQQNTIVAYIAGGGAPVAYFGSTFNPITVLNLSELEGLLTISDNNGLQIENKWELLPFVTGFNFGISPSGTILLSSLSNSQGSIYIHGFNNCSGSPQNFQATQSDVASFCGGSVYSSRAAQKADDIYDVSDRKETETFDAGVKVYPNPNLGTFSVIYTTDKNEIISLSVNDLSGKQIIRLFENEEMPLGTHKHNIVLDDIAGGIYICTLQIGEKTYREKVVVVK